MESVECVVVGAGVVGLAVARALALAGREVVILEANDLIGSETSARNSEVIHAGIYYPAGSLMAQFCVAGREALYAYCRERGVPHRNCGKLIVATDDQELSRLPAIAARAAANGVDDLQLISASEALGLEPALHATGALISPSTGIIDSHAYMLSLLGDTEASGGVLSAEEPAPACKHRRGRLRSRHRRLRADAALLPNARQFGWIACTGRRSRYRGNAA